MTLRNPSGSVTLDSLSAVKVVVTGGSGGLGSDLVRELRSRGVEAVPASRRTGLDLSTGKGLTETLTGADVIVHAASHKFRYRTVDLGGTRRVIGELRQQDSQAHIIYTSIVGAEYNPYPYFQAKRACEMVLRNSGLPVTVVRATQFHELIATVAGAARWPVAFVPPNIVTQPCERTWIAEQLADIALAAPPDGYQRSANLAGPETLTVPEAIRLLCEHDRRKMPKLITLPKIGRTLKALALGINVPGPDATTGGRSFAEWLKTR
jgi:uncharacterized protein YbjT (DUF2867 family)